jgi:hypothetical protein
MKHTASILFLLMFCVPAFAQVDKEEKEEKKELAKQKVDYTVFRRQMLTLKEYSDERRKIAELQKTTKQPVKITAFVDSASDADDTKILIGYIRESVGDNATDIYEVTYDRSLKKIIFVKPTGEILEIDGEDKITKKAGAKKTVRNKEEDEDGEAPRRPKQKQKDPDEDDE